MRYNKDMQELEKKLLNELMEEEKLSVKTAQKVLILGSLNRGAFRI